MRAYIETYGCVANKVDSEIMTALLKQAGVSIAKSPANADVIILNTCAVKSRTELRMVKLVKKYSKRRLIVAGCLPQARRKLVRKLAPSAKLLSPAKIDRICELVLGKRKDALGLKAGDKSFFPQARWGLISRILISEGCLGSCSYCITKLARGNLRSFSRERIASNVAAAISNGAREVWLTSQDCAVYGIDRKDSLANLLETVTSVSGDFMVRVGMANPSFFLKGLKANLKAWSSPKVFKFFHLPLQSGSDSVLRHMRRSYRARDFEKVVKAIRKKFPTAYISTDIIVGYPTETEKDWGRTLSLIKKTRPEIINISRFSSRPGTPAAELKELLSRDVKGRSRELTRLHQQITLEANREWIGKILDVFVDERTPKGLMGRTRDYRPVAVCRGKIGQWRRVRIAKATSSYLKE